MPAKPFLQLRKALKRNASFDSEDVKENALHLLDALEQDISDILEEDEEFEHSANTEKYSAELKECLEEFETEQDDDEDDDEEEDE